METSNPTHVTITRQLVAEDERLECTAKLFGIDFPMRLEPFIYAITDQLACDYHGGYWHFYELNNGGFYMAPHSDKPFRVSCENGFSGLLSSDALGIVGCLYGYSHLSFGGDAFADICAQHYHLLRSFVFELPEVGNILAAID